MALVKQEDRQSQNTQLPRQMAKRVGRFLHAIPNKDQRVHPLGPGFRDGMLQDPADLGLTAQADNPGHAPGQLTGIAEPGEGLKIMEAAVIDELNVEPAHLAHGGEHLGLDLAGLVPAGLAAGGGVESKDEPAPRAHRPHAGHGGQLLQEGVDRACLRFLLGQLFTHGTEVVQPGADG